MTITDPMLAALAAYVEDVRNRLGLRHWKLIVYRTPPVDTDFGEAGEFTAQIEPTEGRYLAVMRFSETFWSSTPSEQRNAVAHELIHLIHLPASEPIRTGTYRQALGDPLADAVWEEFRRGIEYTVDHLTNLLAAMMPLPETPKPMADPDEVTI